MVGQRKPNYLRRCTSNGATMVRRGTYRTRRIYCRQKLDILGNSNKRIQTRLSYIHLHLRSIPEGSEDQEDLRMTLLGKCLEFLGQEKEKYENVVTIVPMGEILDLFLIRTWTRITPSLMILCRWWYWWIHYPHRSRRKRSCPTFKPSPTKVRYLQSISVTLWILLVFTTLIINTAAIVFLLLPNIK